MRNEAVIHDAAARRWLLFRDARRIITADTVEDVLPALDAVERMVAEEGLYAAGCIGYEASPAFDPSFKVRPDPSFPLLRFGMYTAPEVISLPSIPANSSDIPTHWTPTIDRAEYDDAVLRIKDAIAGGETYQVNFTFRLHAPFAGDPWGYFLRVARAQEAEYAAYVDMGRFAVCSASPELFFRLDGAALTARPMKGTAPRGLTAPDDRVRAEWLYHSEKNRAENIMIVDMMRNDLGRIAKTGSVAVPRLFDIERYPTLWQMTSTVTAESDAPVSEILGALFPCASITGAPKSHTTSIIANLETTPRNIYTGCIGFIAPERKAQFNVAIRTVMVDRERKTAEYGVGGGVVWDSMSEEEYEECRTKTQVLLKEPVEFSLLETMLHTPEEGYFLLDSHIGRLRDSAEYFGIPVNVEYIREKLETLKGAFSLLPHRIRVIVSREGEISCEFSPIDIAASRSPVRLRPAVEAVSSANPFLYHKTTNREVYESARAESDDCDDILLFNERGEITETRIANVVFRIHGELVTPPVSCGLLPGTFRARLIEEGLVREKIVRFTDLTGDEEVYVINSVRKMRRAVLLGFRKD